jgi:hypothetical protein
MVKGNGRGCLLGVVGTAAMCTTLMLGPIDFSRTVYNNLIGDMPVLKRQLVDYVRAGVYEYHANTLPGRTAEHLSDRALEAYTAQALATEVRPDGRIDPQAVSTHRLWDAAEEYATSAYDCYVWTRLK